MSNVAEVMEVETSTGIVEFNAFEAQLAEYKAQYKDIVYDLSEPEQEKQAKSDKLAIGKTIAQLDRAHKEVKSPLKAKVDLLDGERKRIKDGLLEIQGDIKSQLDEHAAAIAAIEAELLRRASAILELAEFDEPPTSPVVSDRLEKLRATVIDESYGDMQGYAALNKEKAAQILEPMLAGLVAQEKEAAEAERLRLEEEENARIAREEKIAKDATEKAEREAQERIEQERQAKEAAENAATEAKAAAERKAKEAAERAERDKAEAVERAKREAKEAAEKLEAKRLADIEKERVDTEKREANKKHRSKINNAAVGAIIKAIDSIDEDQAKEIITLIAQGKVPAVQINY